MITFTEHLSDEVGPCWGAVSTVKSGAVLPLQARPPTSQWGLKLTALTPAAVAADQPQGGGALSPWMETELGRQGDSGPMQGRGLFL